MGFEKFGVINHVPEAKVAPVVDYLEKGEVRGTKCKKCGTSFFPPRADCSKCLSSDMEWVAITKPGKLVTYSKVYYGPAGFEDKAPYVLGVAQFGDLKVFGFINKSLTDDQIKVGMDVRVAPINLPEGKVAFELNKA
jgi:uncharacterized protein